MDYEKMDRAELVERVKSLENTNKELLENLDEVRVSCNYYKEANDKLISKNKKLMEDINILKKIIDKSIDVKESEDDLSEVTGTLKKESCEG